MPTTTSSSASTARPSRSAVPDALPLQPTSGPATGVPLPAPLAADVLGVRFHATRYTEATDRVMRWAARAESRAVFCSNTHSTIEARDDAGFRDVLNRADLNTPDGVPIVWAMRHQGLDADRVYGPDLTLYVLRAAAAEGVPVGFYGSTPETLAALLAELPALAPGLEVACALSPPFRPLSEAEDEAFTAEIVASGARVLFVGLGCPRQERWVDAHRDRIPAVMLAVGAAFDFHAGRVPQAPPVLQRAGLEWAFRLVQEPRRLWRRYARVVPGFVWGYALQALRTRRRRVDAARSA